MNSHKNQVRKFYATLWNAHDLSAAPQVLHDDVTFRGSLGQHKHGYGGFSEYVDSVHQALGNYECIIDDMVAEGDKVFAKMTFRGVHQGEFLGQAPTGKLITWVGTALFTFVGTKISDVWVLGDLHSLLADLEANA